jgi:hypothetical protein
MGSVFASIISSDSLTVLVTFNGSKQGVSIKTGNCPIEAKRMNSEMPNKMNEGKNRPGIYNKKSWMKKQSQGDYSNG